MRASEDRSGPLVTCTGNSGRSPVPQALLLTGSPLVCIPYTQRSAIPLCYCLCALTEIGSPMLIRVNNDVILGLTTGHWSTPCDIIIDPNYHRTPYFRHSTQSQQREKVPTFYVYRYSDQRQGPLNNNACGLC